MIELNKKYIKKNYKKILEDVAQSEHILPTRLEKIIPTSQMPETALEYRHQKKKKHMQRRKDEINIQKDYKEYGLTTIDENIQEYRDEEIIEFITTFPQHENIIKNKKILDDQHGEGVHDDSILKFKL